MNEGAVDTTYEAEVLARSGQERSGAFKSVQELLGLIRSGTLRVDITHVSRHRRRAQKVLINCETADGLFSGKCDF